MTRGLQLTELQLSKLQLSTLQLPKLQLSKLQLPKLQLSKLQLSKLKLFVDRGKESLQRYTYSQNPKRLSLSKWLGLGLVTISVSVLIQVLDCSDLKPFNWVQDKTLTYLSRLKNL